MRGRRGSAPSRRAGAGGLQGLEIVSIRPRRRLPLVLVGVAALAACGRAPGGGAEEEVRRHFLELRADVGWDRLPRSAGYDSAASYVARTLERVGVEPGTTGPDARRGFLQPVPLLRSQVGDGTWLEVGKGGITRRIREGKRTFLLVSPGRAGSTFRASAPVFVGRGIHAPEHGVDDLAGLDLTGRPALITATPPDSAELALLPGPVRVMYADPVEAQHRRMADLVARGVAAILLVPERWLAEEWDAIRAMRRRPGYAAVEPYPGFLLESPVPIALLHVDLVDGLFLGRDYHPISHAGRYRPFELDDLEIGLEVDVRREPRVTANVIGSIPGDGRLLKDEYVIVSAQLDGYEGGLPGTLAEDAAACAALLEVARTVARERPKRSVLFVFFIVEAGGVWGSLHLLAHPPVPLGSVVAAIHVGGVGRPGSAFRTLQALASPPALAKEVEEAGRPGSLVVRTGSHGAGGFRGTPSEVFLEAGIPSMLVTIDGGSGGAFEDPDSGSDGLVRAADILHTLVVETAGAPHLAAVRSADAGGGGRS